MTVFKTNNVKPTRWIPQDNPRLVEGSLSTTDTLKILNENDTACMSHDYEIAAIPGDMGYGRNVSMKSRCEPKGMSELTSDELRVDFFYLGGDRESCDKVIGRRVPYEHTKHSGVRRYAQDLVAALPRKHMHRVRIARECMSLVHVDVAERP